MNNALASALHCVIGLGLYLDLLLDADEWEKEKTKIENKQEKGKIWKNSEKDSKEETKRIKSKEKYHPLSMYVSIILYMWWVSFTPDKTNL